MGKYGFAIIVLGSGLVILLGIFFGFRDASRTVNSTTESRIPIASLNASDSALGFFCASSDCSQEGLNGTASKYDSNSKLITFQLNEKRFDIFLNDSTVIDNTNGILYFEKIFEKGDVLKVIFDRLSPQYATEVYFHKTGSVEQRRRIENQNIKQ